MPSVLHRVQSESVEFMNCSFPGEASLVVQEDQQSDVDNINLILAYCDKTDLTTSIFKCSMGGEIPATREEWEAMMIKENLLVDLKSGDEFTMDVPGASGHASQLIVSHLAVMTSN